MANSPHDLPEASVERDSTMGDRQGSLQTAIEGKYSFSIKGIISEAWTKTRGNKLVLLASVFIIALIFLVLEKIIALLGLDSAAMIERGDYIKGYGVSILTGWIVSPIIIPLTTGLYMSAIRIASGKKARIGQLFAHYDRMVDLIVASIISGIITYIGFLLFVIPGIYFSIAYSLSLPLVVEKGLGPWQALETSRKALTHRWFGVSGLMLTFIPIFVAGIIPLMLGTIWTLPLFIIALGVLYRTIFGFDGGPE